MACGIPTAVTGGLVTLCVWLTQRKITKSAEAREQAAHEKEKQALEREHHREKLLLSIMQTERANTVLNIATARAVQRIPDAHCNGDMTNALKHVNEVQNAQKDFLIELGIHSIYD